MFFCLKNYVKLQVISSCKTPITVRKMGDKLKSVAHCLYEIYEGVLLDTQLLSNLLGECILVDNDVHSLVSNECLCSVEHTLVRTVFTP